MSLILISLLATAETASRSTEKPAILSLEWLNANQGLLYYNLSCYAAVDGRTVEAKSLLSKAIELDPDFKQLALEDEDLAGIW
jgi:hypothetical protein